MSKTIHTRMMCLYVGFSLWVGSAVGNINITPSSNADALVGSLLGPGITLVAGSATYVGADGASGFFAAGFSSGLGVDSGILMTTGSAASALGPNKLPDTTTAWNGPGDADLEAIEGMTTNDAAVLDFDFQHPGGSLYFNYVFASEEYDEYVNSQYDDIFAFILDGQNLAVVPGTSTRVSVNTVHGATFPQYYHDNTGGAYDLEYDGFTSVFTAQAQGLAVGQHHIKLAIADTSDCLYDSAVFLQGGTFDLTPPPAAVPVPGALFLTAIGTGLIVHLRRKGARV